VVGDVRQHAVTPLSRRCLHAFEQVSRWEIVVMATARLLGVWGRRPSCGLKLLLQWGKGLAGRNTLARGCRSHSSAVLDWAADALPWELRTRGRLTGAAKHHKVARTC
jgi:hypothetical protein